LLATDHRDLADAANGFHRLLDLILCKLGDLTKRFWCRDSDTQNGSSIGVEFLDRRLLGRIRQIRDDGLDAVLDLLRRDVHILLKDKLNEDLRDTFDGCRTQFVDAADRIYGFFDL